MADAGLPPDDRMGRVRRDTPGSDQFVHLDNAGASPMPQPAFERMIAHLSRETEIGGYAAQRETAEELESFNASVAELLNAVPSEIAFTENATRAWDMAFYGIGFRPGDRILSCRSEYASNYLAFLHMQRRAGVDIEIIPDGPDGTIDIDALAQMLDHRVRLVNLCHVPTSNGLINDAAAVGKLLRGHAAIYLLDACQSVGQIAIDVEEIGCDILSATGRKFLRGPRGTGFLYVSTRKLGLIDPPFVDLRSALWDGGDGFDLAPGARRFESWEYPVASKLGFKAAIEYAMDLGLPWIAERSSYLADLLRARLASLPRVEVLDRGTHRCAITTFAVNGLDHHALQSFLISRHVSATVIEAHEAPLDLMPTGHRQLLRLSPHYFNTEEEIDRVAELVGQGISTCA